MNAEQKKRAGQLALEYAFSGEFSNKNNEALNSFNSFLAGFEAGLNDPNKDLLEDDVEWVVNDMAELGVKIGNQFFFLYKGRSYSGGEKWRYVGKREFGECCHPWSSIEKETYGDIKTARPVRLPETYVGFYKEEQDPDFDNPWQDISKKEVGCE